MNAGLPTLIGLPALVTVCLLSSLRIAGAGEPPLRPLPEGNTGLAAKYPGDVGIEKDPAVVSHADFEDCRTASDLHSRWDAVVHEGNMSIAEEAANVHAGKRSVKFTVPRQEAEYGLGLQKVLTHEHDVLFLRFYSKFEKGFDIPTNHSCHNGGSISAHYFIDGRATPGERADGRNKFLANFENESGYRGDTPSPGLLNIYLYHPEQRSDFGDHFFPSGTVLPFTYVPYAFGPHFVSRRDITVELDRWYCFEYMLKANTPGQRDGRIACWLDGKLIADFPNLRLRDVETLKMERFGVGLYIGGNPVQENAKWYDDVVAATSYIGPQVGAAPK
jgi:hypothetical protein